MIIQTTEIVERISPDFRSIRVPLLPTKGNFHFLGLYHVYLTTPVKHFRYQHGNGQTTVTMCVKTGELMMGVKRKNRLTDGEVYRPPLQKNFALHQQAGQGAATFSLQLHFQCQAQSYAARQ